MNWKQRILGFASLVGTLVVASSAAAQSVSSVSELRSAVDSAGPGDVITIEAGTYTLDSKISITSDGMESDPITVRAEALGDVTVEVDALEGFVVNAPHWQFENLDIVGVCANDSDCEHALHLLGRADGTEIRNSRLRDFNAQVKGNGSDDGPDGDRVWPDDVIIEHSELFDSAVRQTANPVTKIDVVGGRRWAVRGNFIRDFAKGEGNNISYAAFFKGNSRDGLFARNLVACSWNHSGEVRLGLSFGGGGTGPPSVCEEGTCTPEHQNGVMRNNIVVNCSDVGIYLNEAKSTTIVNNTVVETRGIDARFQATDAEIRNNLLTGRIKDRDGGTSTRSSNLVAGASTVENWFPDPSGADFSAAMGKAAERLVDSGEMVDVRYDYCGDLRDDGSIDIGAIEYTEGSACDTTQFGHDVEKSGGDTGVGDGDAGDVGMSDDTGTSADTMSAPDTGSDSTMDGGAPDAGDAGSSTDGGSDAEGCGCSSHSSPAPAGVLFALCVVAAVGRRTGLSVRRSAR